MNHSDRVIRTLQRVSLGTAVGLLLTSACWADGFEPFGARSVARFLGVGSAPGYHAYPCTKYQAQHYNRSVLGRMHPRAAVRHEIQTPMVPPVLPCPTHPCHGPPCDGCGVDAYSQYGSTPSAPLQAPPATLNGTIEPAPHMPSTIIAPTEEPSTRAHQGTTAPPEEATRAPETVQPPINPPQTGSPFQYDPRSPASDSADEDAETAEPSNEREPDFGTRAVPEMMDALESQQLEDLPPPTSGRPDPKVWW